MTLSILVERLVYQELHHINGTDTRPTREIRLEGLPVAAVVTTHGGPLPSRAPAGGPAVDIALPLGRPAPPVSGARGGPQTA